MNIFTHFTEKNKNETIDFLQHEIDVLDTYLIQNSNKYLLDYSQSLFIIPDKDDDTLILN